MPNGVPPQLPKSVSVEEIESFLDRVALAIVVDHNGEALLPMFEWLEGQLAERMRIAATMERVQARVDAQQISPRKYKKTTPVWRGR